MNPDLTNQSHGQKFVQAAIDFIRKQGFQHIRLVVATYNERAIKVYERCGFKEADYEWILAGDVLEEFVIIEYGVENR
ncbi:GNAT family N-acetyltransferase [Macrococcus hajekii]|uniref:GNAT family N-acetyltransferase n=1 Tax=Macrococcus hajekii TaxID=198482 RepID=A0A4R6BJ21_9STAP|nr:GNAT family N-acetyltransferase [Macrococcus hajekii]TDM01590.1 GNAT family N-acetyltransferase [Macrococcus hajekii]GGB01286.1 hypothetical protein GCM10007190_06690 [Macrococcus hajekii]